MRPVQLSFSFLLIAGTVMVGNPAWAQPGRPKKSAGTLLQFGPPPAPDLLHPMIATSWDATRPSLTSPKLRPPLRLKVVVRSGESLPEALRDYVTEGSRRFVSEAPVTRQIILDTTRRVAIEGARDSEQISNISLLRPPRCSPVQPRPRNEDARKTHSVDAFLGTFDYTEHGKTVVAAVVDGGRVLGAHQEFLLDDESSRVQIHATTTPKLSEHSTHVAGTMAAKGVKPKARGMAKELRLISLDFRDDLNVLETIAGQVRISNHSYGPATGWDQDLHTGVWYWWGDRTIDVEEDAGFGRYTEDNEQLDDILVRHPNLVTFVAAGNDRNDGPPFQPVYHCAIGQNPETEELEWQISATVRNPDGYDNGGLDTLGGLGLSKNCICVGAIHDIVDEGDPIRTTAFSSWGPADDGRIKPDLVANGQDLLSASSVADDAYVEMPGTSMASPTAAGIGALLLEQFHKKRERWPAAAEIKALLIHTATDAGKKGPDPIYGWGSISAYAAGHVIDGGETYLIEADQVNASQTRSYSLERPDDLSMGIRVTVVWTDPPAPPNTSNVLDDATPTLQNDLDVELVAPDQTVYYPYRLVRSRPLDAAETGVNKVDNVERIDADPQPGKWTIRVKATDLKVGSKQSFALVVTGLVKENG